jgi:hypothetical protein
MGEARNSDAASFSFQTTGGYLPPYDPNNILFGASYFVFVRAGSANVMMTNCNMGPGCGQGDSYQPTTYVFGHDDVGSLTLYAGVQAMGAAIAPSLKVFMTLPDGFWVDPVVTGVPKPSTWAMLLIGFAGVGFMTYRRKRTGSAHFHSAARSESRNFCLAVGPQDAPALTPDCSKFAQSSLRSSSSISNDVNVVAIAQRATASTSLL